MIKVCKLCGKEYTTRHSIQKYCSRTCASKAFSKKYKGINSKTIKSKTYICKHCGKEFMPKQSNRATYCSRQCSYEDKKAKAKAKINPKCIVCGKEFKGRTDAKYCSDKCRKENDRRKSNEYLKSKHKNKKHICKECGKEFIPEYGNKRRTFCSDTCLKEYVHQLSKVRRRRKIKENGEVDLGITLNKLIKRDKDICKMCGKAIDIHDYLINKCGNFIVGDKYPSIDHIIPIAKGGTHTWNNVQLAHFRCNTLKSDRITKNDRCKI